MLNNNRKKLKIVHRRMFSQDSKKRTSTTDDNSEILNTNIRKKTNFIITPNRARTPTQKYRIYARENPAKRHFERPPINKASKTSKNNSISFLFEIERKVKIIQREFRRYLERKAEKMKLMNITVNSINTDSIDISSDGFSIE